MACPLCGEHCTCSFAASTRVSAPPSLTYEYEDDYSDGGTSVPLISEDSESRSAVNDLPSRAEARDSAFDDSRPPAPPEDIVIDSPAPVPAETQWKDEVASRLQSYRARRGTRRPRFNGTLSLDFDRATNRMLNSALAEAEANDSPNEFFGATSTEVFDPPATIEEAEPAESLIQAPEPAAPKPVPKIIEFPRLPTLFDPMPGAGDLADPVLDKPRILYVPEEVPTAEAPLADIQLNPEEPAPAADLDLPLCVAPMGQRFFAGLTDISIVLVAAFVFLAIVLREVPPPDSRVGYTLVAALPAVLWAIYHYLFLVHAGGTPGMQMARLSLASFDSEVVGRHARRARALFCILSAFPLGMGLIWALLDDDTLCWHDRITRTYLVASDSSQ